MSDRDELLTRMATAMHTVVDDFSVIGDIGSLLTGLIEESAASAIEIYCASPAHKFIVGHECEVHVESIFTEGLLVGGVPLVGDTELATLLDEIMARRAGQVVRHWFRLTCPVCAEHPEGRSASAFAEPEVRAENLLPRLRKALALGVPRVDLYALQRYISG